MDLERLTPDQMVTVGKMLELLGVPFVSNDAALREKRTVLEGCIRVIDAQLARNREAQGE